MYFIIKKILILLPENPGKRINVYFLIVFFYHLFYLQISTLNDLQYSTLKDIYTSV